jgi:6-phosphogluconolactonase
MYAAPLAKVHRGEWSGCIRMLAVSRTKRLKSYQVACLAVCAGLLSSCGGSSDGGGSITSGNAPAHAYVSAAGTLTTYSIDSSNGELTPSEGTPLTFPTSTPSAASGQIAVDPSGQLLYLIQSSSVYGYAINPTTGALNAVPGSPFAADVGPTALAFDAAGTHLYIAGGDSAQPYVNTPLAAYSVASSGALTPLASYSVLGRVSTMVAAGNYLYVAALDVDSITVYSIGSSGELSASLPGSAFATNPGPYSIAIDPSGAVLYLANGSVTTQSSSGGGVSSPGAYITAYTIDSSTGALTPARGTPTPVTPNGAVSIDPTGKFLVVPVTGGVSVFDIDTMTGLFTTVPGVPFPAGALPLSVSFDRRSRSVYVVNGGSDNVSEFSLGSTGMLTPLTGSPVAVGSTPTYMAVVGP